MALRGRRLSGVSTASKGHRTKTPAVTPRDRQSRQKKYSAANLWPGRPALPTQETGGKNTRRMGKRRQWKRHTELVRFFKGPLSDLTLLSPTVSPRWAMDCPEGRIAKQCGHWTAAAPAWAPVTEDPHRAQTTTSPDAVAKSTWSIISP